MHSHASHSSETSVSSLLKYRSQLFQFVKKRVNDIDLAEDILQDSLLKAFHKAPEIAEEEKLVAWFYSVLRNTIIDNYRKNNTDSKKNGLSDKFFSFADN